MTVSADPEPVRHSLRSYALIILTVALPVIGLLIFFSEPLIRLFFGWGQFTGAATGVVATVQRYSPLTIPPAMVTALVLRLISSLKANHLLLRAGALSVALNPALDLILTRRMGVAGVGLSAALVQFVTLIYLWRRRTFAGKSTDDDPITLATSGGVPRRDRTPPAWPGCRLIDR
jgi:putative peptidoglycan lipid II flippase